MAIDLNLARTSIAFAISDLSYPNKETLLNALLENNNLLEVVSDLEFFEIDAYIKLNTHVRKNVSAALEEMDIEVKYFIEKEAHHCKNFKFDDELFYQSDMISFKRFAPKQGVKYSPEKLAALKNFMLIELSKCQNLTHCFFSVSSLEPGKPFLSKAQIRFLEIMHQDCIVLQNPRSKYKSQWALSVGVLVGLSLLLASFPIMFMYGMKAYIGVSLLSAGSCFFGTYFDKLRQKFHFNAGKQYLQDLQEGNPIQAQAARESLVVGEAAKEWKGYFKSYVNFKTYLPENYRAFAAGIYSGENELKAQQEAIKKLRA